MEGHAGAASLLAPAVAICFALATKRVIPSLAAGVVTAALVAASWSPVGAMGGMWSAVRHALFNLDHLTISAFSLAVAATVGVMGESGGTRSMVRRVETYAKGSRGAMVSSWLAGAIVFFDDYANCLVVGNAMGPLCDKHGVSRAKLSYIVDSTAAPVASLALVSTWVGYEVGIIQDALPKDIPSAMAGMTGFSIFIDALPYRFYSLFTIVFVGSVAIMGRDFGPMFHAEQAARRARKQAPVVDEVEHEDRTWLAALPVLTLVVLTLGLLLGDGVHNLGDKASSARLFEILGAAKFPYVDMLCGALVALWVAVSMSVEQKAMDSAQVTRALWKGVHPVFEALVVLYLAWSLVSAVETTGANHYLSELLGPVLPPWALPTAVFLLAGATAFATGTSFGTMGILIPLVVPLAIQLAPELPHILFASTAAVLAGACLGDHASPISDTTVLSALGSGVDVVTHVRTQLPYALTAGSIAVFAGTLPAGFGVNPLLLIPIGAVACIAVVRFVGRSPEDETGGALPADAAAVGSAS